MKDGDIKHACEHMARILHLLATNADVFRALQVGQKIPKKYHTICPVTLTVRARQAMAARLWAPVPALSLVVEAVYVLTAPAAAARCPDFDAEVSAARPARAWPRTSRQLAEPYALVAALKGMARGGSTLRKVGLALSGPCLSPC